ncbi:MAG TPA: GrpB family protein [Xanthobacteraceae bacterium]
MHDRIISIIDYDPAWPRRFDELAARARGLLGAVVLRIEHVGSTAVIGLAAKPVIDLDIVVNSPRDLEIAILKLAQIGYIHEGDLGVPGREAFRSPAGEGPHHLYVLVEGTRELQRHLAFRDALRADAALRDEYSRLKRSLAIRHADDRVAYTDGKTEFVQAVLASRTGIG